MAEQTLYSGVLPVYKPAGPTSHDVVHQARKMLGTKRIGHAGTLDPFAEGVLVLLIGEATRLQQFYMHHQKMYSGEITLGSGTDTDDRTGRVIIRLPVPDTITSQCIQNTIHNALSGQILQTPPQYSAVHVLGKRAYALARSGEHISIPERIVHIFSFTVSFQEPDTVLFKVTCSAGTYIRSLARDLGKLLGTCAHLKSLVRDSTGVFTSDTAVRPDAISEKEILPAGFGLTLVGEIPLTQEDTVMIKKGVYQHLLPKEAEGLYALVTHPSPDCNSELTACPCNNYKNPLLIVHVHDGKKKIVFRSDTL